MAQFSSHGMNIAGISVAVPEPWENNTDSPFLEEAERSTFIKTTGIEKRHIARTGQITSDLMIASADQIIDALKWNKSEIDLVVCISQSPDYLLPSTSIIIQDKLGLSKSAAAFDITLGCSGYVYGLSVINSMMATGGFRKALLLAGDISSHSLNKKDKSTWPLFGDAATATALEYDPSVRASYRLHSDGSGYEAIIVPDGGMRNPISADTYVEQQYEAGVVRHRRNLWLKGFDIFNFSVREVPKDITALLDFANVASDDVDHFVFHQANFLMNETIRKKLKIPAEKVPYSLKEFGNTSSATIPVTIVSQLRDRLNVPRKLVLSGFGVGLSWASCVIDTRNIVCPEVLYI